MEPFASLPVGSAMDKLTNRADRKPAAPNCSTLKPRTLGIVAAGIGLACCGRGNPDRLNYHQSGEPKVSQQSDRNDSTKRCSSKASVALLTRELFRRAEQTRGGDDPSFEPVVAGSTLTLDGVAVRSVNKQLQSVTCTATARLDLPKGVVAAGGRTSLASVISYVLQPAADQSGEVVTLADADAITIALATVARHASQGSGTSSRYAQSAAPEQPQLPPSAATTSPVAMAPRAPVAPPVQVQRAQPVSLGKPQLKSVRPVGSDVQSHANPERRPSTPHGWRLAKVIDDGQLNTRIYIDPAVDRSSDGKVRFRAKYIGTLNGQAPVETSTDESVECTTGFHTQHSYVVRNAQGRLVASRGEQPRRHVFQNSMLRDLMDIVCR